VNNFMPLGTIKETSSGDYDKADVERYISELMSDFSRVKSVMQRNVDVAKAEKERVDQEREQLLNDRELLSSDREVYLNKSEELEQQVRAFEEKLAEMSRLQDDLDRVESERLDLAAKLGEIEGKNIQNAEDLEVVLDEKREIESQNQMLQDAYEEALERIRLLTQEKEDALQSEQEAQEKLSAQNRRFNELANELDAQSRMYDELASEMDNIKSINEELEAALDKGFDFTQDSEYIKPDFVFDFDATEQDDAKSQNIDQEYENRYGTELVTDSGMELFRMLRGFVDDGGVGEDNGVRMTQAWEEETEETIPGSDPDSTPIIKKTRRRSEVSVEYIGGNKK